MTIDMSIIAKYIRPELLIVVIFLWCLGLFLKKAPWFKEEWMIPFILLGVSIIVTIPYIAIVLVGGFSWALIISGLIQAVIIAALAVFGNETIKQAVVKRLQDKGGGGI
jgi:hypothetical protein